MYVPAITPRGRRDSFQDNISPFVGKIWLLSTRGLCDRTRIATGQIRIHFCRDGLETSDIAWCFFIFVIPDYVDSLDNVPIRIADFSTAPSGLCLAAAQDGVHWRIKTRHWLQHITPGYTTCDRNRNFDNRIMVWRRWDKFDTDRIKSTVLEASVTSVKISRESRDGMGSHVPDVSQLFSACLWSKVLRLINL